MLPYQKLHIYTSHKQWRAHEIHCGDLVPGSIITIENYQMNLEVSLDEAGQTYATNKFGVAMHPLCVQYFDEEQALCKGAIVFLSVDKLCDHQQIERFDWRTCESSRKYDPNKIAS